MLPSSVPGSRDLHRRTRLSAIANTQTTRDLSAKGISGAILTETGEKETESTRDDIPNDPGDADTRHGEGRGFHGQDGGDRHRRISLIDGKHRPSDGIVRHHGDAAPVYQ